MPYYRVVVADARMPRDGRFIEIIGHYDPKTEPSRVEIDKEKASQWLAKGAQPTQTVIHLFEIAGIIEKPVKAAAKKKAPAKKKVAAKIKKASKEETAPKEGGGEGGEGVTSDAGSSNSGQS